MKPTKIAVLMICTTLLAAMALSSTQAARGANPAVPGKIAYIKVGDIWVANADGNHPMQLTSTGDCHSPAWSPDGTRIAYLRANQLSSNIWLLNASKGGTSQQLTKAGDSANIAWSPSGTSIVYCRSFTDEIGESYAYLWCYDLGAKSSRRVLSVPIYCHVPPAWSPNGELIAFIGLGEGVHPGSEAEPSEIDESSGTGMELQVCSLSDQLQETLYEPWIPWTITWSPDSKCVYLSDESEGEEWSIIQISTSNRGMPQKEYPLSYDADVGGILQAQFVSTNYLALSVESSEYAACALDISTGVFDWKRIPHGSADYRVRKATFLGDPDVFWVEEQKVTAKGELEGPPELTLVIAGEAAITIEGSEVSWAPAATSEST